MVVWLALGAGLAALTSKVADWFVMTDELLYERLAIDVDRLHSPLPHIHHQLVANVNQLYPLVLAPVFARGGVAHDLHVAHVMNAFAMTSAVVPAYFLALRVTGARWAGLVASLLTGVVPWVTLSSFLLTDAVAYPAFVWALLAFHASVTSPSKRNDALAVLGVVAAVGARTQLVVLALVLAIAIVVHDDPRRHIVVLAAYAGGLLVALAALATGHNPLGTYATAARGNPFPLSLFPALLSHLATVALGLGLMPFVVGGAWLLARARGDVFATLGVATIACLTVEVASYDVRFGAGIVRDRYLYYLAPVLAVAFAAALASRVPRPWLAPAAAVLVAGFALAPLPLFDKLNVDTPASVLDNYLRNELGGLTGARIFLAGAAALVAVLVLEGDLLLRRTWFIPLLAVLALLWTTAQTAYAFDRLFRVNGTAGRPLTLDQSGILAWVDRAVGVQAQVTEIPFPTTHGDYWAGVGYWWDLEFWNKSVDRSAGVQHEFEWTPSTFPKLALRFDERGRASESPPGYVAQALGDTRFHIAGTVVTNDRGLFLVQPAEPWRADWSTSGLYDDGWTRPGETAQIRVYPYPGQSGAVMRSLTVSLFAPSGVDSRGFTLGGNGGRAGANEVSQDFTVCVPPDRAALVGLSVDGSSLIYGDARDEHTAAQPRLAGLLVSRIYLSGAVGASCQVRKASSSTASASGLTSPVVSVPVARIVSRSWSRYGRQWSQPAICASKRCTSAASSAPSR